MCNEINAVDENDTFTLEDCMAGKPLPPPPPPNKEPKKSKEREYEYGIGINTRGRVVGFINKKGNKIPIGIVSIIEKQIAKKTRKEIEKEIQNLIENYEKNSYGHIKAGSVCYHNDGLTTHKVVLLKILNEDEFYGLMITTNRFWSNSKLIRQLTEKEKAIAAVGRTSYFVPVIRSFKEIFHMQEAREFDKEDLISLLIEFETGLKEASL